MKTDPIEDVTLPPAIDPGPDKIIGPGHTYASVTAEITGVIFQPLKKTPKVWFKAFVVSFALMQLLLIAATWLFIKGVGIWGIIIPVAWGFAIVNFVWWIGIGHAGTLISAILLLLKQD